MPEFYTIFARKIFIPEFWGNAPPSLVSYAYDLAGRNVLGLHER